FFPGSREANVLCLPVRFMEYDIKTYAFPHLKGTTKVCWGTKAVSNGHSFWLVPVTYGIGEYMTFSFTHDMNGSHEHALKFYVGYAGQKYTLRNSWARIYYVDENKHVYEINSTERRNLNKHPVEIGRYQGTLFSTHY